MPIDPNIALQVGQGVTPLDPTGAIMKGVQLRDLMFKTQAQQRLRDLAGQVDLSTPEGQNRFVQGYAALDPLGAMKARHDLALAGQEDQTAAWRTQQAKLSALNEQTKRMGDMNDHATSIMLAAQDRLKGVTDPTQRKLVFNGMSAALKSNAQAFGIDTDANPGTPPDAWDDGKLQEAIARNMTLKDRIAMQNAGRPVSEVGRIVADQNSGAIPADVAKAALAKATHIAPAAVVRVNSLGPSPMGETALDPDPARPWRADPRFSKIPPDIRPLVDQYLNGDLKVTSRDKRSMMARDYAAQIDPNVSAHDYDLKQAALSDKTVNSANAALGHVGDFMNLLSQLDQPTRARVLNTPLNKLTLAFSDSPQARIISELETTATSLAGEYGNSLGDSKDIAANQRRENVFDFNKPLGMLYGNLSAVGHLMDRVVAAKENMLNRNNPKRTPLTLLDPNAVDVLRSLGITHLPGNRRAEEGGGSQGGGAASGIKVGDIPKKSDGSILPDGDYHGFTVKNGKVSSVE